MRSKDPLILPDNKTLLEFLEALFQHRLPQSLRIYTYFYLGLRLTLFSIIAFLIIILLKKRRFWLFRMVKVPKGRILCPNACEGLLSFALVFYVCDSIYRVYTLQWYWNDSSPQTNIILFTGMRFFPLWIAGFVHVVAIAFLGPISPARLNPTLYHIFLIGGPVALVGSTMPSLVLGNMHANKANVLFQKMRIDIATKSDGDIPNTSDLVALFQISHLEKKSFIHFRNWAITGAIFNIILMTMHFIVGFALLFKIYSALRLQKRQNSQEGENITSNSEIKGHTASFSVASTCVDADRESFEVPTEQSRRNVLREFFIFTAVQTFCLLAIGANMLAGIIYLTNRLISDQKYQHNLPLYREKLIEVGYTYQLIEMGSVLVFGTPLMIMILYRHCFPVKVELKKKTKKQWQKVGPNQNQPSTSNRNVNEGFNITVDTSRPISSLPNQSESHAVSPTSPISPFEQKVNISKQAPQQPNESNHTLEKQNSQEIARDACAYAGHGVGRSIVLDALDHANQYPRRRRRTSPWETITNASTFTDLDQQPGGTNLYATPHGVVEGMPLSPIAIPEESLMRR